MTDAFRDYQTPGARERRRARRRRSRRAASTSSPAAPTRTCCRSTCARPSGRARTPRSGWPRSKLTVNRNTVPFDERPPTVASGVRIGTPAATMRGFDEDDFREVGRIIVGALADGADVGRARRAERGAVRAAAALPGLPRLHHVRRVTETLSGVTVVDAPARPAQALVPARQATRRPSTSASSSNEVTLLLTYEATKDFPTETVEIETPLERTTVQRISGKKVAVCPVLRAGRRDARRRALARLERARRVHRPLPRRGDARAGRVLREAARADLGERDAIVLDPMLATGNSSVAAIEAVKEAGARSVTLVCLVAAPEGIEHVHARTPGRAHRHAPRSTAG